MPRGYAITVQPAPEVAAPDVALEGVTLLRDGDALIDLDVFDNFDRIDVTSWLQREMAYLRTPGAAVRTVDVPRTQPRALRIEQPASDQTRARTIVLLRIGPLLVRVTCQDASDARALAAFEGVVASLTSSGAQ